MSRRCNVKLVDFGSIKALVSVQIGCMEVRGFKVADNEGESAFVIYPHREFIRNEGREFHSIVRINDNGARRKFDAWLLREYRKALKSK